MLLLRFGRLIFGLFLYALGIVFTIKANIGYAPWDVFHIGISKTIGITIGAASIIVGLLVVLIVWIAKEKIGFGTLLNMILIGIFMDILFYIDIIPIFDNAILGFLELSIGLFIIAIASYFYINSGFGAGPRDSLMIFLVRKAKLPVGVIRTTLEILVTFLGWLLGGKVGIGTVIAGFWIGFCIQITFKALRFNPTKIKHQDFLETINAIWCRK